MMAIEKGTYALIAALEQDVTITVGRLARFSFPAGCYLYAGSARGGLVQRVRRHVRREKRLRWHIDYLLEHAEVMEVWYKREEQTHECLWAAAARALPRSSTVARGFGSSDCRCPTHLVHFPSQPSLARFRQGLGDEGRGVRRASPDGFR